jgi:hypothetical protein
MSLLAHRRGRVTAGALQCRGTGELLGAPATDFFEGFDDGECCGGSVLPHDCGLDASCGCRIAKPDDSKPLGVNEYVEVVGDGHPATGGDEGLYLDGLVAVAGKLD